MNTKSNTPKRKRLTRSDRLVTAPQWIREYAGKNIVRGYAKWFGVDKLCAIKELEPSGVLIPEKIKISIRGNNSFLEKKRIKQEHETETAYDLLFESDEHFAFIAGFTENGNAFGISRQQTIRILNEEMREEQFRYFEGEQLPPDHLLTKFTFS